MVDIEDAGFDRKVDKALLRAPLPNRLILKMNFRCFPSIRGIRYL